MIKKVAYDMNKRNKRLIPVVPPILDMMDIMLENNEVEYLYRLSSRDYSYNHLQKISNKSFDQFNQLLDGLMKKGFLMVNIDYKKNEYYGLMPIVVGWIEVAEYYHRGHEKKHEFQKQLYNLLNYFRRFNINPLRSIVNRFGEKLIKPNQEVLPYHSKNEKKQISINQNIENPGYEIHPLRTINDLIEDRGKKGDIYAVGCVCRNMHRGIGRSCEFKIPVEDSCLFFGSKGIGYSLVKTGYGRNISKEEAIDILQEVSEKGALHSVFHEEDDISLRSEIAICNCCLDCCGLLRGYNAGSMPQNYRSYYYSKVENLNKCEGCSKCEKHCPTLAISMFNEKVLINKNRCIGCGQCTIHCPKNGVLSMVRETRNVLLPWLRKSERRFDW